MGPEEFTLLTSSQVHLPLVWGSRIEHHMEQTPGRGGTAEKKVTRVEQRPPGAYAQDATSPSPAGGSLNLPQPRGSTGLSYLMIK